MLKPGRDDWEISLADAVDVEPSGALGPCVDQDITKTAGEDQ